MAVVGSAEIIVRAITNNVARDIREGFEKVNGSTSGARRSGESLGDAFARGFKKNSNDNMFGNIASGLAAMVPDAMAARKQFQGLVVSSNYLGSAIATLVGGFSAVIGGIGGLAGAALGATPALIGLGGAFVGLRIGIGLAGFALGGISQAVSAATGATGGYSKTIAEATESLRQLRFEAEGAQYSEERATLALERAQENLRRMQDLPPNSRARREAKLALKEADLALRQAIDRRKRLNKEIAGGVEGQRGAKTGGADPYAGLTPSQTDFAKFLVGIQGKLDQLKESVAKGFLPELEKGIDRILSGKSFKTLEEGFAKIGISLGKAVKTFSEEFVRETNLEKLGKVFETSAYAIEGLGIVASSLYSSIVTILAAADPVIRKFVDQTIIWTGKFKRMLEQKYETGELEEFFKKSDAILDKIKGIFANTFGAIGNIIAANFEEGSGGAIMLDYLTKVSQGWEDATLESEQYFKDTATNTTKVLDSLGALAKAFLNVGDNPNIGKTFEALGKGAPAIESMLDKFIDAGPAFGTFVTNIVQVSDYLTDSASIATFFETLNVGLQTLKAILENELVASILKVVGPILAVGLAFSTMKTVGSFAIKALTGVIITSLAPFGITGSVGQIFGKGGLFAKSIPETLELLKGGLATAGRFLMANPVLLAIGLLAIAIYDLYTNSKEFRDFMDTAFEVVGKVFSDTMNDMNEAAKPIGDAIDKVARAFGAKNGNDGLKWIMEQVVGGLAELIAALAPVATFLIGVFADAVNNVVEILVPLFDAFFSGREMVDLFFEALSTGDWNTFWSKAQVLGTKIEGLFTKIRDAVANIFIDFANNIIGLINDIGRNLKTISGGLLGWGPIKKIDRQNNSAKISPVTTNFKNLTYNNPGAVAGKGRFTPFANGGTVFPSRGGSIINVAEAGRPERIEPLDRNGLSDRDKAMIEMLSGGAGGSKINIVVNPAPGMDERELAAVVSRQLAFQLRKGGIR